MAIDPEIEDRDVILRVKGHLYEIEETNDEYIGSQQGLPMSISGYESTLLNVADCTNNDLDLVDEVARYIKDHISEYENRPSNRKVRRIARNKLSQGGFPSNRYLNAA